MPGSGQRDTQKEVKLGATQMVGSLEEKASDVTKGLSQVGEALKDTARSTMDLTAQSLHDANKRATGALKADEEKSPVISYSYKGDHVHK